RRPVARRGAVHPYGRRQPSGDDRDHRGPGEPAPTAAVQKGLGLGARRADLPVYQLRAANRIQEGGKPAMKLTHSLGLSVLLSALPYRVTTAHHAFSPVYDGSKTVTIAGTLTDFRLVNPHAMMTVDVVDKAGKH